GWHPSGHLLPTLPGTGHPRAQSIRLCQPPSQRGTVRTPMLLILALVAMLVFMAIGTPAAVAMGLVTIGLVLMMDGVPTTVIAQTAFKSVNSYPLMAIPMFVLAGNLMMRGRIAEVMVDLVGSVMRAIRGGMALTAMLASVF